MKNTIISLLMLLSTALLFGWLIDSQKTHTAPDSPVETRTAPEREIMSIRELQTFLSEKGHSRYVCKIDGKMGPQTLKAWDNYICDRYYKESTYGK